MNSNQRTKKKPDNLFQPMRSQYLPAKSEKPPIMRLGRIKADTPVPLPHVTQEKKQQEKSVIRRARKGTNKYNTRSKVNRVTTFKNTPQMFKKDTTDTSTTHIGSYYISETDPKKGYNHSGTSSTPHYL